MTYNTFNPLTATPADVLALFASAEGEISKACIIISKVVRLEHATANSAEARAAFIISLMHECDATLTPKAKWDTVRKQIQRVGKDAGFQVPVMNRRTKSVPVEWPALPAEAAAPVVSPTAPTAADTKGRIQADVPEQAEIVPVTAESLALDLIAALTDGEKLTPETAAKLSAMIPAHIQPVQAQTELALAS